MTIEIGDKVWFTSKYGDRVTGIFEGMSTAPEVVGDGLVEVETCLVRSTDAFGSDTKGEVLCSVPPSALGKDAS